MKLTSKKRVSWDMLTKVISSDHKLLCNLYRSSEIQRLYYMNRVAKQHFYASFDDFIKITVLRFGSYIDEAGKLKAHQTGTSLPLVCCENVYPYNVRKGIHHWNLWSATTLHDEKNINQIIAFFIPTAKKITWFVNEPHNMSVPDVWHCHIFWK